MINYEFIKAYQAEKSGYRLVVIVDNREELVEGIQMITKNHTLQLNIPTVLISRSDGEMLRKHILTNQGKSDVFISIKFEMVLLMAIC